MTELVDVLVPDEVTHVRVLSTQEALRAELVQALGQMRDAGRQLTCNPISLCTAKEIGGLADEVGRELLRRAQEIELRVKGRR